MEFYIHTDIIEDAEDIFLIAKDRLLDVNDWQSLFHEKNYSVSLTDNHGQKAHRNARVHDLIKISPKDDSPEMWVHISQIQYDGFPDINSESISILLEKNAEGDTTQETILVKREKKDITIHCNAGNELPEIDDTTPNDHINNDVELHPVLSVPNNELQELLQSIITVDEYVAH